MRLGEKTRWRVLEALILAAGVASGALPASAGEMHDFNVPAEAAPAAIRDFASQARVQILVAGENVTDKKLHAVTGEHSTAQGLKILLADSGLKPQFIGERSIALVGPANRAAATASQAKEGKSGSSSRFHLAQSAAQNAANSPAVAAGPSSGNTAGAAIPQLEEIIVTAERRRERAIDAPISITAIDAAAINATGATSLEDLAYKVPGLTSLSYGAGSQQFVELRGVSDFIGTPSVGRYFDEMPMNLELNGYSMDVRLLDMERVEVLRGPQPTLYGDGSVGGTIRYIPASPTLHGTASGAIEADYTSLPDGGTGWLTRGHADVSLIPGRVGLRLAGWYEKDGGWIDRAPTGQKDINSNKLGTARATLLAKLTDRTELKLLWQHGITRAPNQNFGTDDVTRLSVPSYNYQDSDLLEAVFTADLGFAQLVETPGYLRFNLRSQLDLSPFLVPYLALFGLPPGYVTEIGEQTEIDANILYNEIRLVSSTSGPWSWAAGFDFKNTRYGEDIGSTTAPNVPPFTVEAGRAYQPAKTEALWGEVGYDFSSRWHAGLGVRDFRDRTQYFTQLTQFGAPSQTANEGTFTSTNPRLDIRYAIGPDWNVYFDAGKGFRSGGFNAGYAAYPAYSPDELWTEELGTKGLFFDHRLQLDADVYHNDWKNVQSDSTTPAGLVAITNSGRIKGTGIDLAAALRPLAGLELGATFGWNNMSYEQVPLNLNHAVGDPPDLAVRESWSGYVQYRRPVAHDTNLYGRADVQHGNRGQFTSRNSVYTSISNLPARSLLNLRLGAAFGRYDVSIYAENVLNERNPIIQAPLGTLTEDVSQQPRLYGVAVRATF